LYERKTLRYARVLLWLLLALFVEIACADRVVPSNRVASHLNVRVAPNSSAAIVGALEPGDSARLDHGHPHWYGITLDNGTPGFVSKAWSQVIPDPPRPQTMLSRAKEERVPIQGDVLVTVATLLLGAVTAWMAFETRRMSRATLEMAKLDAEPFIRIQDVIVGQNDTSAAPATIAQHQLIILNPGKVLVKYTMQHFRAEINGQSQTFPVPGARDWVGILHPRVDERYYGALITVQPGAPDPTPSRIEFVISYWSVDTDRRTLRGAIEQGIRLGPNRGNNPWNWVDGPHYT
jgi:hypothetical protein